MVTQAAESFGEKGTRSSSSGSNAQQLATCRQAVTELHAQLHEYGKNPWVFILLHHQKRIHSKFVVKSATWNTGNLIPYTSKDSNICQVYYSLVSYKYILGLLTPKRSKTFSYVFRCFGDFPALNHWERCKQWRELDKNHQPTCCNAVRVDSSDQQSSQKVVPNTAVNLEFSGQPSSVNVEKQKLSPQRKTKTTNVLSETRLSLHGKMGEGYIISRWRCSSHIIKWCEPTCLATFFRMKITSNPKTFRISSGGMWFTRKRCKKSWLSSLTMGSFRITFFGGSNLFFLAC